MLRKIWNNGRLMVFIASIIVVPVSLANLPFWLFPILTAIGLIPLGRAAILSYKEVRSLGTTAIIMVVTIAALALPLCIYILLK